MEMNSRPARPVTILLVNFHSTYNAGDAALLDSAIRQLRVSFVEPRIVVSANYPAEPALHLLGVEIVSSFGALIGLSRKPEWKQLPQAVFGGWLAALFAFFPGLWHPLKKLVPPKWRTFIDVYHQADLVVNCPGNQFFTMGKFGWPLLVSLSAIFYAHLFRKPVYIMPQSIGPLNRPWERRLVRSLFSRCRLIFARESYSLRLAGELGLPAERVKFCPDLAFDFPTADRNTARAHLQAYGCDQQRGAVGVTVIGRMTGSLKEAWFDKYYSALAGALERLAETYSLQIYFFPQVTGPSSHEDDRVAARKVAGMMTHLSPNVIVVEEAFPPDMLKALYGLMDIFIATRMHSGIFASSMGVPTLFIGYLTKIRGLVETLDLEEWLVELSSMDENLLSQKAERLWAQRAGLRQVLLERTSRVQQQTRQMGRLIADDYYGKP